MKKVLLVLVMPLLLVGCIKSVALSDGYQIGDGVSTASEKAEQYCSTTSPITKALLVASMRVFVPNWKPVCTIKDGIDAVLQEP